jgi:hypothetical protein
MGGKLGGKFMIILINFEKFLSNYHNMNILCGIAAVFGMINGCILFGNF